LFLLSAMDWLCLQSFQYSRFSKNVYYPKYRMCTLVLLSTPSVWPGLSGASTGTNVRRRSKRFSRKPAVASAPALPVAEIRTREVRAATNRRLVAQKSWPGEAIEQEAIGQYETFRASH
jgi:hypothetical protein